MRLRCAGLTAVRLGIAYWPVERDAGLTRQLVFEPIVADKFTGRSQPRHAHAIVAGL
jgi:hypothetical protein